MHSKSDNIEIMISDETDEVIKELFDSIKNRYHNNVESVKGSEFVFDYVHLMRYKCHKINPNRGRSCIVSPYWIKSKIATINPINKKDNQCFQYAVRVVTKTLYPKTLYLALFINFSVVSAISCIMVKASDT